MGRYYLTTRTRRPYPNIGLMGRFLNGPKPPLVGTTGCFVLPYGMGGDINNGGLVSYSYGATFPGTIIDTPFGWSPTLFSSTNLIAIGTRQTTNANPAILNTPARTVSCWVNFSALSNAYTVAHCVRENGTPVFTHLVKSTGKVAAYVTASASVNYDGTGSVTLVTGTWYNLIMGYDSVGGLNSYVNGVLDKNVAANGAINVATLPEFLIGNNQDGLNNRALAGMISDVCYWNRLLTAQEAWQIYSAGLRGEAKIGRTRMTRHQSIIGCNGNITGHTYANGAPVARRVVVSTQAPNARVVAEMTTSASDGLFAFNNLAPGDYSVEAVMTDNTRQALVYDWIVVAQ